MLDRRVAPPFSHSDSIALPSIKEIKLADDLSVLYFDQVKQALVKIEFIYKAGKWYEPLPGLSHFTANMLEKGTSQNNSSVIAGVFDRFGAHVEISPGFDFTSVALYTLSEKLESVLPLFLEITQQASFPQDELELMKSIFAQNLKVNNEKNSYVASKLIRKNIFGESHPYGSNVDESALNRIHSEETRKFFLQSFHPFEIYITGLLTDRQLKFVLQQLNTLRQTDTKTEAVSYSITPGLSEEYHQRPESIQTSIRLGKRTINKGNKDFFDLLLLNHILGGYFGSRLMKNIREEKGLTYGIYSSLSTFHQDSFFGIGADVNKENQEVTIKEIKHELDQLRTKKIAEQELIVAKNHLIGSIQLDMANPFSVLEKIKNIRLNQLDPQYYSKLLARVAKVTASELVSTAQTYLHDQDLFIAKVG